MEAVVSTQSTGARVVSSMGNWLNGYLWTREPGPCFVITGERKEVQQDEESHYKKELFEAKELLMHIHHSLREALEDLSLSLNQPKLSVDGTHVAQLHERESSDSEIEEFENFDIPGNFQFRSQDGNSSQPTKSTEISEGLRNQWKHSEIEHERLENWLVGDEVPDMVGSTEEARKMAMKKIIHDLVSPQAQQVQTNLSKNSQKKFQGKMT
eukprot:TRINITY_DN2333_c0_g1_i3.p1 TRINITY_DN2333_c0_g1~~TRINITY_DN2333_c0_g1_i3.p1  ORF type:complete len:211 (+),score=62.46 TRINITY_DN2333_c0_g1_i3:125-757(+)